MNNTNTFQNRIAEQITSIIAKLVGVYFELYSLIPDRQEQERLLDFQYRESSNATAIVKAGWFFLLFILLPVIGLFDYSSVLPFLSYLSAMSGSFIGTLIDIGGWLFFLLIELSIGWLLVYSKGKPLLRFIALVLACAITILPSFLIYTTYYITEDKTELLQFKTIALMVVSVMLHLLLFLVISEVWTAINHYAYLYKKWRLKQKDLKVQMKKIKEQLQQQFTDFDTYVGKGSTALISNRAWYLKKKFENGSNDYDLSDYDPNTDYSI